ncbi:hypothetical protein H0A61_00105 [Koleobacter methoxysyntrophicus]|uniref:Uncharacterized protein n=1 Tax=Koleobacter methoxysyntrophicus TaxID=2751313 RepID=A0A8A0RJS3_9FIRM|nr:hypothetical protein H0A61_00105 [Koleobacter methoxysyntrophicus]
MCVVKKVYTFPKAVSISSSTCFIGLSLILMHPKAIEEAFISSKDYILCSGYGQVQLKKWQIPERLLIWLEAMDGEEPNSRVSGAWRRSERQAEGCHL